MDEKKVIEVRELCYAYEEEPALCGVNLSIKRGTMTALLGENGAGKSTLFLNLNGILHPASGEVFLMGKRILYKKKEIWELRKRIGIVFQNPDDQLFCASVYQDVSFGPMNMGLSIDEVHRRTNDAMARVGISHLKDRPVHDLSFGQKKKAAIAGVIAMKPPVILLDEPTAGLDPRGIHDVMELLKSLSKEEQTAIMLSTHDIDMVPDYCDDVYIMRRGKIMAYGRCDEIFAHSDLFLENHLTVPRISQLVQALSKQEGICVDVAQATVQGASKEILKLLLKS